MNKKAYYSTLAEHTIPDLRSTLQFHARGDNTKYTIPRLRRPHKAHNSALAEYITYNSTLVETIQSTQFRACGGHIKHTIPCLRSTLQFRARGDNTKHRILRLRRPYKPHNSALAEHITITCSWRQHKAYYSTLAEHTIPDLRSTLQFYARGDNTKYTISRLRRPHKAHNSALAEYITYNSTLVETIQSTQFRTCGGHIKHTIPCFLSTLQFHAH